MRLRPRSPGSPPASAPGREVRSALPSEAVGAALLVTGEPRLLDLVGRLAAAAALRLDVVGSAGEVLQRWAGAGVVLVGPDLAEQVAALRPPARPEVHVLTLGADDGIYRHALALGAHDVVELPRAEAWLGDALADLAEGRTQHAATVAVVAGSGGAGASVLAAALAQVAARDHTVTLVDLDAGGAGADRLLGLEDRDGLRWGRLTDLQGRVSSRALREALPGDDALRVLTWDRATGHSVPGTEVVGEVVAAARRGSDVCVLDLPRDLDRVGVAEVARQADLVVLCAASAVLPVAAAGRVATGLRGLGVPLGLVVRTGTGGLDPLDVADVLGLPLAAQVPTRRRTVELLDLGLGPARSPRSPLARAARQVLRSMGPGGVA
ncbi:MAG TPA: septum site-determining protein Ssd [Nocardioides sp.]|nr:septum site-determining protein Ssd [Nocardioides sp.]